MPRYDAVLETLCCPASREPLRALDPDELRRLNAAIARGALRRADGTAISAPLEAAFSTAGSETVYAVEDSAPVLVHGQRVVDAGLPPEPPCPEIEAVLRIWEEWAPRWTKIQPPARPIAEEIAAFERFVGAACAGAGSPGPRALLLGVTPEIATMRWPAGTRLLALDLSPVMIRTLWPHAEARDAVAARADWRKMPVKDGTYDVVIGDGVLLWQRYPDDFVALAREIRRVLMDDGALVVRLFAKPDRDDPLPAIFADLRAGRIPNSAVAHLRLGTALRRDLRSGTRLGDVYDVWHANVPDEGVLLPSLGWWPEWVGTFEAYRGLDTTLAFLTVAELSDVFSDTFRLEECRVPSYDEHGMCPTVVFRAKS
jgi:SAM-dependent methyltransferase